ncbi:MAG: hypothetical protein JWN86_2679 [Planctomycetota bacterium]|nr:hypothetical protein [Planctomycetota bacterium]
MRSATSCPISRRKPTARWLLELEYYLWQAVIGIRDPHNQRLADEGEIVRLKELSQLCGGWIVFGDSTEETWLPLEVWEKRFEEWTRNGHST